LDEPVRILFTFAGGTGHLLPLVPLARAAERAGHVVAFAGQDGMVATIARAGFTAFTSGGASLLSTDERAPLLAVDPEREARAIRNTFRGSDRQ
jgi:UDP:flavonoid glycosyltransferase YjiC (YdhE family)